MKWSDPKKKLQIFLCFLKVASRWQVVRMKGTHEVFEATTIEINQQSVEPQIGMFNIKTNTRGEKFQSQVLIDCLFRANVDDFRKITNPCSKVFKKTC